MSVPFLKWAGGKRAVARQIVEHVPATFERYYEPFLGGGAIFFELRPARAVLGDGNAWLTDTWEALRDDWHAVARQLPTWRPRRAPRETGRSTTARTPTWTGAGGGRSTRTGARVRGRWSTAEAPRSAGGCHPT